ncbi:MAG: hypothetical protein R3182_05200, partial [Draconibacterium sp.]|nr:hypothetical protein [Draconibacterium sp.]
MITLFFILGILATLFIFGIVKLNQSYKIGWAAWLLGCLGIFLLLFAIAWSVSSVIEAEPRAASMGMVFFGIPSVILIALG